MDVSDRAIIALSKGLWIELDELCDEWLRQISGKVTPMSLQMIAWIFSCPPRPNDFYQRMEELFRRQRGFRLAKKEIRQYESDHDLADNPIFQVFASFAEDMTNGSYALRRVAKRFPDSAEVLVVRGVFADEDKTPFYEKALEISPNMPIALLLLSAEYNRKGRMKDSARLLLRLIEVCPDSVDAHIGLARIAQKSGQQQEATYHYNKVLTLDPSKEIADYVRSELNTNLATVIAQDVDDQDSEDSPLKLDAIPEKGRLKSGRSKRRTNRFSNFQIWLITMVVVILVSGIISSAIGFNIATVAIVIGILVSSILIIFFRD